MFVLEHSFFNYIYVWNPRKDTMFKTKPSCRYSDWKNAYFLIRPINTLAFTQSKSVHHQQTKLWTVIESGCLILAYFELLLLELQSFTSVGKPMQFEFTACGLSSSGRVKQGTQPLRAMIRKESCTADLQSLIVS